MDGYQYLTPSASIHVEDIFSQRPRTLSASLEVMVLEIFERLRLRELNSTRIVKEKEKLYEMIRRVSHQVLYNQIEHVDLNNLYKELFSLEQEIRQQDTECWKDIVMVMHTLLPVWQAHESAVSRARMVSNVS